MFELAVGLAWFIACVILYLLPSLVASMRGHPQENPIFIINFFLGWTLIGWIVTLAWAVSDFQVLKKG